jgi:predicted ATP-dependent serine protease
MKNIVSLTVSFFARNKKQFRLINEIKNRFVITKRNTIETVFVDTPTLNKS